MPTIPTIPGAATIGRNVGTVKIAATLSGNEQTDTTRAMATQGDGETAPAGIGFWPTKTNLCTNGGFTTNLNGTGNAIGTETRTRITTDFKFGVSCMQVATPGGVVAEGALLHQGSLTNTTTYTCSAWVRVPSGTTRLALKNAAFTVVASVNITASASWQRVLFTYTAVSTETHYLYFETTNTAQSLTLKVDGVQVELGPVASPYIETDGGTAARTETAMTTPWSGLFTSAQGWFAVRYVPGFSSSVGTIAVTGAQGSYPRLAEVGNGAGSQNIALYYDTIAGNLAIYRYEGGVGGAATKAVTLTRDTPITLIFKWNSSVIGVSDDGSNFTTVANTKVPDWSAITNITLGEDGTGNNNHVCGRFLWVATGDGDLSDNDAAALHAIGNGPPSFQRVRAAAPTAHATAVFPCVAGTYLKQAA